MKLTELLNTLANVAKENNLSEPYIVGGLPRDQMFGMGADVKDIDITTGDQGSFALAMAASQIWPEAQFRSYDDGHSSLDFSNIRLDMSNNFHVPGIETELKKIGIEDPTPLQKEMYSRDFTINTLLQPLDLEKEVIDITGKAKEDIKNKYLRTPINPDLTIGYDPRRILRAIKMVIKFGLEIDEKLQKSLLKYRGNISNLPIAHIKKQVNQMFAMDADKTIDLLVKFKLLPIIPLSKMMTTEIVKKHKTQFLLEEP